MHYCIGTVIHIDPADAVPIWKQIEDGIRRLVATGALAPGAPAPSVRKLARDLRVNPATVARAYQRLAESSVLVVHRGEGTFVADGAPGIPRAEKARTLRESAERHAALARTIGATDEEAVRAVENALEKMPSRKEGGRR